MICEKCRCTIVNPKAVSAAEFADTQIELMKQRSKAADVVRVRNAFWFYLTIVEGVTYSQAGRVTGHDHTSVMHGVRRYAQENHGAPPKATREQLAESYMAHLERNAASFPQPPVEIENKPQPEEQAA